MQTIETQFLRNVLRVDALTCLITGVLSVAASSLLGSSLGLSGGLLQGSGIALLAVGAFILFAAKNVPALRWPVWIVVLGNAVWVLASVLLLISGLEQPTGLGTAYVIVQAVIVAVLAELEYIGLRKTAGVAGVVAG